MKLSDNLKQIRKENNLSQEQIAEKLGVSRQAVSKWESGQSYPEMDKVLLICKEFNYNMDELMNENVKEVKQTKESKININKYVEDFFEFITKTVNMFSCMTFKPKIKCLIEQFFIIIILVIICAIIATIGKEIISKIFGFLSYNIYHSLYSIISAIGLTLACFVSIVILLHIFKIRYLDYYEIVECEPKPTNDNEEKDNNLKTAEQNNKIFIDSKKEKIIVRDPEYSQFKFLTAIIKMVLICIKALVAFVAIFFAFSCVGLFVCFVLTFLFAKTGLLFLGIILGEASAILINLMILEILYNFIISKKNKTKRLALTFIISIVLAGFGIAFGCIGIINFNYVEVVPEEELISDTYTIQTPKIKFNNYDKEYIEYVETDSNEITIEVKHTSYYTSYIIDNEELVRVICHQSNAKMMNAIRDTIKDINNKEIRNYDTRKMIVYASKENIDLIKNSK